MNTNKRMISIRTALILFTGIIIGWFLFGGTSEQVSVVHDHSTEAERESIWTCSMHPQIRQNESGDCPLCGMELIPLENDAAHLDPMAISMSPAAMQLADIQTAIVEIKKPVKSIRLNGKITADERLLYTQSSHIPGRIEKLMINFTGEYVTKGQVIAFIYSPELVNAQDELFEAQKIKKQQPQLFTAANEKLRNWKLTDIQIEKILKDNSPRKDFPVLADVSGYVTKKMVNLGDYIQKGKSLFQIEDLSKVWLLLDVYESDIPWIKNGDHVNFMISSLPGDKFSGLISYIDPVIDSRTRVAKARVVVTNTNLKLKPEMFASGVVKATLPSQSNSLVVPKTAVMWTGKRSVVFVKSGSQEGIHFIYREVTLGPALGETYIVKEGLQPGEEIAVNGTFSIDAAAQLAGKPSMMNPEGGVTMTGHDHSGQGGGTAMQNSSDPESAASASISEQAEEALRPLFGTYFNLKDDLVEDDFANAVQSGKAMRRVLEQINMEIFGGNSHNIWMKYQLVLRDALQHIEHFQTIDELRKSFQGISASMIGLAESFGPLDGQVYLQHCPMADSNKGADWLSKEKNIKNPYFGASMLKCGEVSKTIK